MTSSDCPDLERIEAHAHRLLPFGEAAEMTRHIETCASCRHEAEEIAANLLFAESLTGLEPAAPRDERPGLPTIPGITDIRFLARGGQGVVYVGRQESTERPVVIKMLRDQAFADPMQRLRFVREAKLGARIRHPAIVTVLDAGETPSGTPFVILEYVEGLRLDEWRRSREHDVRETLEVFARIVEGVHFAHAHGVIHRDLKHSNILVDRTGHVRILDFGLAKLTDVSGVSSLATEAGFFIGTLAFAAPEQLRGDPDAIDVRTDVYGLGVVLYHLLTGVLPHEPTGDLAGTLERKLKTPIVRPSTHDRSIARDLDTICLRALAEQPEARYPTALDLLRDVRHVLADEPIQARADNLWVILKQTARRRRAAFSAALLALVALVAATIVSLVFWSKAKSDRAAMEVQKERAEDSLRLMISALADVNHGPRGPRAALADFVENLVERLKDTESARSEVRAEVLTAAADAYAKIAPAPRARAVIDRALSLLGAEKDDLRPDVLGLSVERLALSLADGDLALLESTGRDLVARCRIALAPDAFVLARAEVALALILAPKHASEADALARSVASRDLGKLPADERAEIIGQAALARHRTLFALGKPAEALEVLRRAIADVTGSDYRSVVARLVLSSALAGSLIDAGQLDLAASVATPALETARSACLPDDPKMLSLLFIVGIIQVKKGEVVAAQPLLSAWLEAAERLGGQPAEMQIAAGIGVAAAALTKDDQNTAESLLARAEGVARKNLDRMAAEFLKIAREHIRVLARLGEEERAIALADESIAIATKAFGVDAEETRRMRRIRRELDR